MGRIIAIGSQKGGVGKTTTVLNLGITLGRLHGRSLILDLDPQSGLALASNVRRRTSLGLINLIKGECGPAEVLAESKTGTVCVASMGTLQMEDARLLETMAMDGRLARIIRELTADFTFTLIDAPTGNGGLSQGILGASDGVVAVINCDAVTIRSLPIYLKLIEEIRMTTNPGLHLEGLLVSMFNESSPTQCAILDEVRRFFPLRSLFRTVVPFREEFQAASLRAMPVALLPDASETAGLYYSLALELNEREGLFHQPADEDVASVF